MLRSKFDVTPLLNKSGKNAIAVLITDPDQKKMRKKEEEIMQKAGIARK